MRFFNNCNSIGEIKALYKKLAMDNHPDRGGDTATMQAINTEYAYSCAKIAKGTGLSDEQASTEIRLSEEYKRAIEKIIHLPGITIEIVGNWIWVTGNTRPLKDTLKDAGYYFASKKVAWYYRNEAFKSRGNNASLDTIRRRYGTETINQANQRKTIEKR